MTKTSILQRADKHLGMVRIDQLSKADQEYLASKEAELGSKGNLQQMQTWSTQGGVQLLGRIVDYAKVDVTVQRRRGKVYVNDRLLKNLPEVYPENPSQKVIEHFEGVGDTGRADVESMDQAPARSTAAISRSRAL